MHLGVRFTGESPNEFFAAFREKNHLGDPENKNASRANRDWRYVGGLQRRPWG